MNAPLLDMRLDRAYSNVFDRSEAELLAGMLGAPEVFGPRHRLVRAGALLDQSYYLTSGFVGRARLDRAGRRQFLALQIPGDYIDLPAFPLQRLDHDIDTISEVTVRPTPHRHFDTLRETAPDVLLKLWRISLIDAAIHRYWIFRIGRLSGRARVANFFCEMYVRLYARGLGSLSGFTLPLTQTGVAEICGITPVHANRLISELRSEGACAFANGEVAVSDPAAMFRVGHFSWDYLYLPAEVDRDLRQLLGMRPVRA